jgi:hypothetical protein
MADKACGRRSEVPPDDAEAVRNIFDQYDQPENRVDGYVAYCKRRAAGELTGDDVREEVASYRFLHGGDAVKSILARVWLKAVGDIRKHHYRAVVEALEAAR